MRRTQSVSKEPRICLLYGSLLRKMGAWEIKQIEGFTYSQVPLHFIQAAMATQARKQRESSSVHCDGMWRRKHSRNFRTIKMQIHVNYELHPESIQLDDLVALRTHLEVGHLLGKVSFI